MAIRKRDLIMGAGIAIGSAALITTPALPFVSALLLTSIATTFLMSLAYSLPSLSRSTQPAHTVHVRHRPAVVHPWSFFGLRNLFAQRVHPVGTRVRAHRAPRAAHVSSRVQPHAASQPTHSFMPSFFSQRANTRVAPHKSSAARTTTFRPSATYGAPAHTTTFRPSATHGAPGQSFIRKR